MPADNIHENPSASIDRRHRPAKASQVSRPQAEGRLARICHSRGKAKGRLRLPDHRPQCPSTDRTRRRLLFQCTAQGSGRSHAEVSPMGTNRPDQPRRILITQREAAAALSISRSKLADLTRRGIVPCVRVGRRVLYLPPALDTWAEQQLENTGGYAWWQGRGELETGTGATFQKGARARTVGSGGRGDGSQT
jgi:excisionase family DNA binding protein